MDEIIITICHQPLLVQLALSDDQAIVSVPKLGISLSSSRMPVNQALQWAIRSVNEEIIHAMDERISKNFVFYEQVDENIRKCIGSLQGTLFFPSETLPGALKNSVDYLGSSVALLAEAVENLRVVEEMLLSLQQISRFGDSLGGKQEELTPAPITYKEIRAEIDRIVRIKSEIESVSRGIRGASIQSVPSLVGKCTKLRNRWQNNRSRRRPASRFGKSAGR